MMFSPTMQNFSHPPPLAGGGRNPRQRITGGWSIAYPLRNFATPQKFADANFYPPPQAAEGETILRGTSKKNDVALRNDAGGGADAVNIKTKRRGVGAGK